jgi:four helix bundle protein
MPIQNYRQLQVWQKSIPLVKEIYQITEFFPKSEQYGLTAQLRRAAISIPSNIAEGYCRKSTKEYLRHINIAYASLAEVEAQLFIAAELGFLTSDILANVEIQTEELGRMLNGLTSALEKKLITAPRAPRPAPLETV